MFAVEDDVFVAGQILPADVARLAGRIAAIVNNRPDGEAPGQPTSALIEAAALAARIIYVHAPIAGTIDAEAVAAARAAFAQGPTLLFCKSGMRSAALWAMVRAGEGRAVDDLIATARGAQIELGGLRAMLLAAGAR